MAFDKKGLDDYVDVATRIAEFRGKHPAGYLAPLSEAEPYRVETIGERVFIVVVAAAYREPGDVNPGVGMAWEPFPGRTPYTRDSELMNAETSAWGRAIIAVGAADSQRGIASREEVRNRQDADDAEADATRGSTWTPSANPSTRKADRHHGNRNGPLPDDQWTAEPATEESPGTSLPDQHQKIAIRLNQKGITTRDGKLAFCTQAARRKITSSSQLSYLEAAEVLRRADALPVTPGPAAERRD